MGRREGGAQEGSAHGGSAHGGSTHMQQQAQPPQQQQPPPPPEQQPPQATFEWSDDSYSTVDTLPPPLLPGLLRGAKRGAASTQNAHIDGYGATQIQGGAAQRAGVWGRTLLQIV